MLGMITVDDTDNMYRQSNSIGGSGDIEVKPSFNLSLHMSLATWEGGTTQRRFLEKYVNKMTFAASWWWQGNREENDNPSCSTRVLKRYQLYLDVPLEVRING